MPRVANSMTDAPPRCGWCHDTDHTTVECFDFNDLSPLDRAELDILDNQLLAAGTHVRCCTCGAPARRIGARYTVKDTHEVMCDSCGRAEWERGRP